MPSPLLPMASKSVFQPSVSLNVRQRKALARLRGDMSLERVPLPPIYAGQFAWKVRNFLLAVAAGVVVFFTTVWVCIQ